MQVGRVEGALARLVDDRLAGRRIEFGNDVVAGLAAHQDAAHRTCIANAGLAAPTDLLGRGQVGQVRPMALAGMHDRQAGGTPGRQQPAVGLDRASQLRDVIAQHFTKAAGLQEVALHIDDEKAAFGWPQFERIRLGRNVRNHCLHRTRPPRAAS